MRSLSSDHNRRKRIEIPELRDLHEKKQIKEMQANEKLQFTDSLLKNHNIEVIPRSGNKLLGSGAYSDVYEVLYGGIRMIAKVTNSKDAKNYEFIKSIRNSAPPEVAKHLPKIFKIIKPYIGDPDFYPLSMMWEKDHIILMEVLEPFEFGDIFFHTDYEESNINPSLSSIANKFYNMPDNEWITKIKNIFGPHVEHESSKWLAVKRILENATSFSDFSQLLNKCNSIVMPENLSYVDIIEGFNFPSMYEERSEGWDDEDLPNEQLNSFKKALIWLSNTFNFNWADLHRDNIMIRPGTNEYVVSDVGAFQS